MQSNQLIELKDVSFAYPSGEDTQSQLVLDHLSFSIQEGDFVAIVGRNGSGKSTLAKLLNGILTPQSGSVLVDNIDTKEEDRLCQVRQRVGMVFQNPDNQLVATLVEEDVAFAPENLGVPPKKIREIVDQSLKEVDMLSYRNHSPHKLSGGQKQRVAIAGILAMRPKCIVLDESTSMLDPKGRKEIIQVIEKLHREHNTTIVLITHFMEETTQANRVIVLDAGKILLDGSPKEIFSNPKVLEQVGLDVPQTTQLMIRLKDAGFQIQTDILTVQECISALKRLLKGDLHDRG